MLENLFQFQLLNTYVALKEWYVSGFVPTRHNSNLNFCSQTMLVSNLYDKNLFRRSEYHRRRNLDLIVNAIKRISDLNIAVNKRDDIVIDDLHKVRAYMTGIFYSSFKIRTSLDFVRSLSELYSY